MLYALVFVLILVLIIVVTFIRMAIIARQRRKAFHSGTGPAPPAAPRFTEIAREVSHNWFGDPARVGPASAGMRGYQPRYTSGVHPSERERRADVVRDERDPEMGDPELPSYYDSSTLPHPPAAVYTSPIQARRDGRSTTSIPPPAHDGSEPPKYDVVTRL